MGGSMEENENESRYYSKHFLCICVVLNGEYRTPCWDGVKIVGLVAGSQNPKAKLAMIQRTILSYLLMNLNVLPILIISPYLVVSPFLSEGSTGQCLGAKSSE